MGFDDDQFQHDLLDSVGESMVNRWTRYQRSLRKLHRVLSIVVAIPFFVVITSGLLLTTRNFNPWLQSPAPGGSHELTLSFPDMLNSLRAAETVGVQSWNDVSQIDVRPAVGQIRVRTKKGNWEVSLDGKTGAVLAISKRRVSWITSIHEGAEFGPLVRYGIFLPSSVGVFLLLLTGVYIFVTTPNAFGTKRPQR